jgi:hypothetical protein
MELRIEGRLDTPVKNGLGAVEGGADIRGASTDSDTSSTFASSSATGADDESDFNFLLFAS